MTPRMCDGQPRQVCPHPGLCSMSCRFNTLGLEESMAEAMALEDFYRPDYGQVVQKRAAHISLTDRIGNFSYRVAIWWDGLNDLGRVSAAVGLVAVCAAVGVAAVG